VIFIRSKIFREIRGVYLPQELLRVVADHAVVDVDDVVVAVINRLTAASQRPRDEKRCSPIPLKKPLKIGLGLGSEFLVSLQYNVSFTSGPSIISLVC
jgi:hypothetical protein